MADPALKSATIVAGRCVRFAGAASCSSHPLQGHDVRKFIRNPWRLVTTRLWRCGSSDSGKGRGWPLQRGGGHRGSIRHPHILAAAASSAPHIPRNTGSGKPPRVCILGGGFGGLYTAVKMEALLWPNGTKPQVTLVDQSDRFVFKPLLYELLTGDASEEEVAPPFSQLLAPYATTFVQGSVAAVELNSSERAEGGGAEADGGSSSSPGGGRVVLKDGASLEYDWLVVALGSDTATFGIPGVKELAMPFNSFRDAQQVLLQLQQLEQRAAPAEVVVVGGGYAGVELASTVAARLGARGRVQLISSGSNILSSAADGQREAARKALQAAGITTRAGALVTEIKPAGRGSGGAVSTASAAGAGPVDSKRLIHLNTLGVESVVEADLVLWVAGSGPVTSEKVAAPPAGARGLQLPFPTNARGFMETDATLRVRGHPRVFALGDLAGMPEQQAGMAPTAQVAFQQADYVAWNLWAAINARPLLPFRYQHLGEMMSLGPRSGAVALPWLALPADVAGAVEASPLAPLLQAAGVKLGNGSGLTLEGPLAGALRRAAYLYRQPTLDQQLRVGATWLDRARREAAAAADNVLSGRPPFSGEGS